MFLINEIVFAKVKGYQPWPAYIAKVENNKYHVVFIGTSDTVVCKEGDVFDYNKYETETLPNKRITPSLKIALEEAKTHLLQNQMQNINSTRENKEETFSYDPAEESMNDVSEINSQLQYEKEKMESSLRMAEEEAEEMSQKFEKEIASLNEELNYLSPKVCISISTQTKEENKNKKNTEYNINEELVTKLEEYEKALNEKEILIFKLKDNIDELNESAINKKCLHCFPPLQDSEFKEVKIKFLNKEIKHMSPPTKNHTLTSNNRFKILEIEDDVEDDLRENEIQRSSINVFSCVRPGAKFSGVVEDITALSKNFTKDDSVLIIAGTNNMETMGIKHFLNEVQELLNKSNDLNLILATLPMRHDQPNLDLKISIINREIESIAANRNCPVLPLHHLPCHLYTNHGLHMNKRGKSRVAEMIVKIINKNNNLNNTHSTLNNPCPSLLPIEGGISVVEADMREVFEEVKNP
ncbi:PC4 and SFRS1-interacting protein [Homalodisca vitripennis]|nr:PC4 and SFRS1-interacting protein [Homalodisca vitripennis]